MKSWAVMTSTGTAEAVTDRGSARVPTTTTCWTPADRHFHVEGGRGARAHLHHLRGHGEAEEGERHLIRPRGKSAERELAGPVSDGHLRGPRRVLRFHGDAGEHAARRVRDRARDRAVLGDGDAWHTQNGGKNKRQREANRS